MEPILALGFGALLAAGAYMALSRHLLRMVLGLSLIAVGVNLMLFLAGRVGPEVPAFVAAGAETVPPGSANPLPQALVLTAVVIGFSILAFSLVLAYRAYLAIGVMDTDELREAEPRQEPYEELRQEPRDEVPSPGGAAVEEDVARGEAASAGTVR